MKYLDYFEKKQHGTFNFPIAYYHVDSLNPRYEMRHHWHIEHEVLIISEGKMELTIDGEEHLATAGDVIIISDGVVHSGIPHDAVYDSIVFDMRSLLSRSQACNTQICNILNHQNAIFPFMPRNCKDISDITDRLISACAQGFPGYELVVQGALMELLGQVIKLGMCNGERVTDKRTTGQIVPLKQVVSYIEQNYASKIMLADLAKTAGMTPKYFCSFFYGMTRKTPIEYVNYYRIERACEQLLSTDMSITDIGLNCGFNEISYFIKTFRKTLGITPHQYRKKARNSQQ